MDHVEIDVELLISLVEERPLLWDKSLEDYKSRSLTVLAWRDVCWGLYEWFDSLDDHEKHEFGKCVMKKWTNVKDSWLKAQKKILEQQTSGRKTSRKYIYQNQLTFLKKNILLRDAESSFTTESAESNESDITQPCSSSRSIKRSNSPPVQGNKIRKADEDKMINNILDPPEDRHLSFFKGILPSLQELTEEETLDFQMGVLNVLQNIRRSRSLVKQSQQ